MADVQEVIKRLIVEAQTRGLDKAAADFEKFGTAAKQAATTSENALASTGKSFERLAGSIDPARKEIQALARDLKTLESGRGKGVSDEYINGLKEARTASAALAIEAAKANAAIGAQANGFAKMTPRVGLAGHELKNLGMQANDAATMLLSGSSAFQVMATQGGQVLQVLQGGEGITANLKDLGGRLLGLATPANLVFGGLAAGAAAAAVSAYRYQESQKELALSLAGVGRQSGATIEQLNTIAETSAAAGGVSVASAKEMVGAYAAVGKIGPDNFADLIKVQKDYATTTRQEIPAASKELAAAIADPVKGFDLLSEKIGVGSAAMREQIETLVNSGRKVEAQKVLIDALSGSIVKSAQVTGAFATAWDGATRALSNADQALGKLLTTVDKPLTLNAKLAEIEEARKRLDALSTPERGPRPGTGTGPPRTAAQNDPRGIFTPANTRSIDEQTEALDKQRQKEIELADAARKRGERQEEANHKAAADARSLTARTAVESVFPDIGQMSEIERKINDIKLALKDQEQGWKTLSDAQQVSARQALESLQTQQQAMKGGRFAGQFGEGPVGDRMARKEEDFSNQIASVSALTNEQKAAAAVQEALTAATRAGATQDEQAQVARQAYALAIAQSATEMQKALQAQQMQTSGIQAQQALIASGVGAQSMQMAVLTAGLQMEQQLVMQGINLKSQEAQKRIANAEAIARELFVLQDMIRAQQVQRQAAVQAAGLQADIGSMGEEQSIRTALIETAKAQVQVEQLLADGKTAEAAATAAASQNIIALTLARDMDAEAAQRETQAIQQKNAALQQEAQAQQQAAQAARQAQSAYDQKLQSEYERVGGRFIGTRSTLSDLKNTASAGAQPSPGQIHGVGAKLEVGVPPSPSQVAMADASFGSGNYGWGIRGGFDPTTGKGKIEPYAVPDMAKVQAAREAGEKQLEQIRRQGLQTAISTTASAIGKQIESLRDAVSSASDARTKQQALEQKFQQQEDKRQQRIQNYLAAGPSPFEQNADIFYDPKKRMAFAETIAGNTDELLKQQIKQAKAEADAADAASKAAEAQIKALEDQQERLQEQSDLIAAGVDLSKEEVDGINALITEVAGNLPTNIATQFARVFSAQQAQAQEDAAAAAKAIPGGGGGGAGLAGGGTGSGLGFVGGFGGINLSGGAMSSYTGGSGGLAGGGSLVGGTTTKRTGAALGGFAGGGEFTVPGSYGAGDRPFVMGLAGQEKVTIQTPGQQRSGSSRSPTIENLIVQMPPMTDPIIYLNKRSRPALSRAIRGAARGMA